jgi:hypothetical protein
MKRIIRLTESDLTRIVRRIISEGQENIFDKNYFMTKKTGTATFDDYGFPVSVDGIEISDYEKQWKNNFARIEIGGRGFNAGDYNYVYSDTTWTGINAPNQEKPGISINDSSGNSVGTAIF